MIEILIALVLAGLVALVVGTLLSMLAGLLRAVWRAVSWLIGSAEPERATPYPKDWAKISGNVKRSVNWTCEDCKVCLTEDKELLHVHHVNRDTYDNRAKNLRALCVECHSRQPGSGHKALATKIRTNGSLRRVRFVRSKQQRFWLLKWLCSWFTGWW